MGFLDKAKAAANDLAAKADSALSSSGLSGPGGASAGGGDDADRYFRDLGVLAYLEATGRGGGAPDRERLVVALGELESRGAIRSFALQTTAPPAPGQAAATGGYGPPPPPAGAPARPPSASPPDVSVGGSATIPPTAPPPPPPSWMKPDG